MSFIRKMKREKAREHREAWRERRRQRMRMTADHICRPVFRGDGHAYAYCGICGTVMKHIKQVKVEERKVEE